MRLSTESLLMLVALALYLFDSSLFLARNEAVLVRGGKSRWFARFGANRWRLTGKEPFVPNPLTPHRPMFKLAWRFEGPPVPAPQDRRVEVPAALSAFTPFVGAGAALIFGLLPAALFLPLGTAFTLIVVLLLYLNNMASLVVLHRNRANFALSTRQFGLIAFECLVCPPFAINLVRKLCARLPGDEDFTAAAARLLQPTELAACHAACRARLEEEIEFESDATPRMQALLTARVRFPVGD